MAEPQRRTTLNSDGPNGPFGLWENLSPEVLALIFVILPADELVRLIPFVCKAWREVVAGPYCWSDIDIQQWCRRCAKTDRIDFVVRRLVRRSKGTCRRLSAFKIGDFGFVAIANSARCLKVLQIPVSQVSDKMVKKHVHSLKMLTFLDISNCLNITCAGLAAFGKSCTSLIHLKRNLPPLGSDVASNATDEGEAMVIAETMARLEHLELAYGRFSDIGLKAILTKCNNLSHLDIQGCWNVKLEGDLEDTCDRLVEFIDPWMNDYEDANSSGSDGDEYLNSESESDGV